MEIRKLVLGICLASLALGVGAEEKPKYGWTPGYINYSVDDPNGSTESASELHLLGASYIFPISQISRIMGAVNIYDFDLKSSTSNIGQQVETISFSAYYQYRFRWSRNFKPWFGVGLVTNMDKFTKRHRVDSDGFLVETFPDREDTNMNLGLLASYEWDVNSSISMDFNIEYMVPLSESLEGLKFGVSVYYE